jgi:carboxypeptidase Taq
MTALDRLRQALAEVADLERSAAVLLWDEETQMPPGGVEGRANALGTLRRLAHERFTAPELGRLLDAAEREVEGMPYDSDDASLVRVVRRDYGLDTRIPADLVAEQARASARARPIWQEARRRSEWSMFAPAMATTVELSRRLAEAVGYDGHPYDALLELIEPGITTAQVEGFYAQLREVIVPLVKELSAVADRVDASVMDRCCDPAIQVDFALETVRALGYDLERGRQDLSAHPFTISFGPGDVRITTRVGRTFGDSALLSSIHESGHAMYEQGVSRSLDRTPLGHGASPGVHESQSRLWENLVGRSRPFWEWCFPRLQAAFGEALDGVDAEGFWRAVNRVRPSYIRVDADEVTYNLHTLLRFEIEKDLLEGSLDAASVPRAWNQRVGSYLGLEPPNDAHGALQDIHWCTRLGGFVGYTLGNLIGAQLMETVRRDLPDLDARLAEGEFRSLLEWLQQHLYQHGRKFTPNELMERVTGEAISAGAWTCYIRGKFREVYGLP